MWERERNQSISPPTLYKNSYIDLAVKKNHLIYRILSIYQNRCLKGQIKLCHQKKTKFLLGKMTGTFW